MDAAELVTWRKGREMTQAQLADGLGVSKRTLLRWEGGDTPIPGDMEDRLVMIGRPGGEVVETKVVELPVASNPSFDPVAAGLKPGRVSNGDIPGVSADWDLRQPKPGWRRIPGGARVVSASIPNPINFYPPEWAGWRGVVTKDGRVFDFETGREMRPYGLLPSEKPAQRRVVLVAPVDPMDALED